MDTDPLFLDPGIGDFHLASDSPCLNKGDNDAPELPAWDFEGNPRILYFTVDMGVDEIWGGGQVISVPFDASTIQGAVDEAVDGDTVVVEPGTYFESIYFKGKAITVTSSKGASLTTIDVLYSYDAVISFKNSEAQDSILQGFTITNGNPGIECIGSSPTIRDNIISGNSFYKGGGMYNHKSSPTVINCTFSENSAGSLGGGGMGNWESSPTVINCTFSGNSASDGGGMCNHKSNPKVTNCIFSGNSATKSGNGGGMYSYESSLTVTNCTFSENSAGHHGGGMCHSGDSLTVTNCTFSENSAMGGGGGGISIWSSGTITNCTFSENSAHGYPSGGGGGMYNGGYSSLIVTNCTFSKNSTKYGKGGGISNGYSSLIATNCTFSENSAGNYGGGIYASGTVTNCICWNDSPDEIHGSATVTYSNVQGSYPGTGNIDADPLFLDPWNDDYHLSYASPCIDAGDIYAPSLPSKDFEGDPRIFSGNGKGYLVGSPPSGAIVDMGADEYCLMKRGKFVSR
jgi:predicted outer membrane repeat protein/parallel beta-helix repeat protein